METLGLRSPAYMQEHLAFQKGLFRGVLDTNNNRPGSAPPSRSGTRSDLSALPTSDGPLGSLWQSNPRLAQQQWAGSLQVHGAEDKVSDADVLSVEMLLASLKASSVPVAAPSSPMPTQPRPNALTNIRTIPPGGRDLLGGVSWTARAGSASQQLDALLQTYSPKGPTQLLSSAADDDSALQSHSSVPILSSASLGPEHPSAAAAAAAAAAVALQGSLFNIRLGSHSPCDSPSFRTHSQLQMQQQAFDATVGSPVHRTHSKTHGSMGGSMGGNIGPDMNSQEGAPSPLDPPVLTVSSLRSASEPGLGPQPPQAASVAAAVAAASDALAAAPGLGLRAPRRSYGPSKLRISSSSTDGWSQSVANPTSGPEVQVDRLVGGGSISNPGNLGVLVETTATPALTQQQQQQRLAEARRTGTRQGTQPPSRRSNDGTSGGPTMPPPRRSTDGMGNSGLGPSITLPGSLMLSPTAMPPMDDMSALLGGPGSMQFNNPGQMYGVYYGQGAYPGGQVGRNHGNPMGVPYPGSYMVPGMHPAMMGYAPGYGSYPLMPGVRPGFPSAPHDMHVHGMMSGVAAMHGMQPSWGNLMNGMPPGSGFPSGFGPGMMGPPNPEWLAYCQMMDGQAAMAAAMAAANTAPGLSPTGAGPGSGGERYDADGAWLGASRVWPGIDGRWPSGGNDAASGAANGDWAQAARWPAGRDAGAAGSGAAPPPPPSGLQGVRKPSRGSRDGTGPVVPPAPGSELMAPVMPIPVPMSHGNGGPPPPPPAPVALPLPSASRFELQGAMGHICELCLDQQGSRLVQAQLDTASPDELDKVIEELMARLLMLATDVFANYVVQKLLERSPPVARARLAAALRGSVVQLSLHMYGCRVIQRALELLPSDLQCDMLQELINAEGQTLGAARDQNGNHVVQKMIECLPPASITPLLDLLLPKTVELSCHPYGCRVVQRLLERCHSEPSRKFRAAALDAVVEATALLARDQYGNYVVQNILEHGSPEERSRVLEKLAPEVVQLSMHKFASNVVEKGLTCGSAADREVLVAAMLGSGVNGSTAGTRSSAGSSGADALKSMGRTDEDPAAIGQAVSEAQAAVVDADRDPLQMVMKDQYGNFVVQKALEISSDAQRQLLLNRVHAQLHALKKFTYGKHIVSRVEKLLAAASKQQQEQDRQGQLALQA